MTDEAAELLRKAEQNPRDLDDMMAELERLNQTVDWDIDRMLPD